MKHIICMVLLLIVGVPAFGQDYRVEGNNYIQIVKEKTLKKSKVYPTPYTYTDSKNVIHKIYLSEKGRAFYYYINKKGEEKRKYLGEKISKDICNKMNFKYE